VRSISDPVKRVDADGKSLGSVRYLSDLSFDGLLDARLVLSTEPHARIISIRLPDMPPGYVAVDHTDIPGVNRVPIITDTWPLLPTDTVHHVGQPVLLLAGRDPAILDALVDQCRVEYEPLPHVFGIDEAITAGKDREFVSYELRFGPMPETGTDALSLRETFETGAQEHVYMEPQSVVAFRQDGKMTVIGSMQCPYFVHKALAAILGVDGKAVRVIQSTTGGAFGGKEDYPSVLAGLAAVAALKADAPVRIVLDRAEDMLITTKRHPSRISFASSLEPGGAVKATEAQVDIDGGAFEGLSATVLQRAMFSASGVYLIPSALVRGRALRTDVVPFGAFRGFGSPQAFFAIEMHMTHCARELGTDPLDFKRRHLLKQYDRTITGGTLRDPVLLEEMIDSVVGISGYRSKAAEYRTDPGQITRRGIGVSLFNHGCGFTGSGERDIIKARVAVELQDDGATILVSNVEMGQGAETALRKVVAETLCLDLEQVEYAQPDTDRVPDSGPTVASRTVMVVGGLLQRAAQELARRIESAGAIKSVPPELRRVEKSYVQPDEIEWDQETFTGDAYPAFSWGVNVVELEIDTLTFEITPLEIWSAYDIGRAIDTRIVTGQVHGGIIQGLGYATSESLQFAGGTPRQRTMTDYVIPGSLDIPSIHVEFFDNPYAHGPFGAKGAGEIPLTGVAPALADATERALGIPVYRIPLTPEYLREQAGVRGMLPLS
jgi:CO/xanthine dehydrogenase Mo-binding subunit